MSSSSFWCFSYIQHSLEGTAELACHSVLGNIYYCFPEPPNDNSVMMTVQLTATTAVKCPSQQQVLKRVNMLLHERSLREANRPERYVYDMGHSVLQFIPPPLLMPCLLPGFVSELDRTTNNLHTLHLVCCILFFITFKDGTSWR